jgi:hypothetical protein
MGHTLSASNTRACANGLDGFSRNAWLVSLMPLAVAPWAVVSPEVAIRGAPRVCTLGPTGPSPLTGDCTEWARQLVAAASVEGLSPATVRRMHAAHHHGSPGAIGSSATPSSLETQMRRSCPSTRSPSCSHVRAGCRLGQPSPGTCSIDMNMSTSGLARSICSPLLISARAGSMDGVMHVNDSRNPAPSWIPWRLLSTSGRFISCAITCVRIMARKSPDGERRIHGLGCTLHRGMVRGCITSNHGSASSHAIVCAWLISPRKTTDGQSLNNSSANGISQAHAFNWSTKSVVKVMAEAPALAA